jgi:Tol biopolymer transport system component
VVTGSEVTVVPAQAGYFGRGATFTPDGNYLYYTHSDPANGNNTNIYVVPALGGASRQIVSDVMSAVVWAVHYFAHHRPTEFLVCTAPFVLQGRQRRNA